MTEGIKYKSLTPGYPDLTIKQSTEKVHIHEGEPYIRATREEFKEMGIEFSDEFWDKFSIKETK